MKEHDYILGSDGLQTINVGDLVRWSVLNIGIKTGIVKSKYTKHVGGRDVAYAEVLTADKLHRRQLVVEKLIANLRVVSNSKE
jgi:hypothetical protein